LCNPPKPAGEASPGLKLRMNAFLQGPSVLESLPPPRRKRSEQCKAARGTRERCGTAWTARARLDKPSWNPAGSRGRRDESQEPTRQTRQAQRATRLHARNGCAGAEWERGVGGRGALVQSGSEGAQIPRASQGFRLCSPVHPLGGDPARRARRARASVTQENRSVRMPYPPWAPALGPAPQSAAQPATKSAGTATT